MEQERDSLTDPLDVVVEREAPPEEIQALEELFRGAGVRAEVRAAYVRLSALDLPYAVYVLAPLTWIALKFLGGAAGAAGTDAWEAFRDGGWLGLQRFVQEVGRARGERDGSVVIRDPEGPDVVLSDRLPEEAFRVLAELDWRELTNGQLFWNQEKGDWHHATPGARRPQSAPKLPRLGQ